MLSKLTLRAVIFLTACCACQTAVQALLYGSLLSGSHSRHAILASCNCAVSSCLECISCMLQCVMLIMEDMQHDYGGYAAQRPDIESVMLEGYLLSATASDAKTTACTSNCRSIGRVGNSNMPCLLRYCSINCGPLLQCYLPIPLVLSKSSALSYLLVCAEFRDVCALRHHYYARTLARCAVSTQCIVACR